jgi:DNA-binding NtrC family response regulator
MQENIRVLIVDDEKELRESLADLVEGLGHKVDTAENGAQALEKIKASSFDLLFLDVRMPEMDGITLLEKAKGMDPSLTCLMLTAHSNLQDAVHSIKLGAFNYLEKPIQEHDVHHAIQKALEARQLVRSAGFSSPKLELGADEKEFIGESSQMKSVFNVIHRLSHVSTSVLIRGENGTGKELVARAIHYNSPRKNKRFVAVNCGAIPENLIESELFGHEKGAFTGAESRQIGKFQYAEGGTLFLDEIGELSPPMQVKLLRVLQERKLTPIGSNREISCDVRIIAATTRDLERMIDSGAFRQDLFYRLNVMTIFLPPLRERKDDIEPLVYYFIEKFNEAHDRVQLDNMNPIEGIQPEALEALKSYSWPGNIRELENSIERSFVLEQGSKISLRSLPESIQGQSGSTSMMAAQRQVSEGDFDYSQQKEEFEKQFIINALRKYKGKINQTVAHAKIPKNTLLRKIKKYGIDPSDYNT